MQGVYVRGLAGSAGLQACLEESMVSVTRNTGMLLLGIYLILVRHHRHHVLPLAVCASCDPRAAGGGVHPPGALTRASIHSGDAGGRPAVSRADHRAGGHPRKGAERRAQDRGAAGGAAPARVGHRARDAEDSGHWLDLALLFPRRGFSRGPGSPGRLSTASSRACSSISPATSSSRASARASSASTRRTSSRSCSCASMIPGR